MKTKLFLVLGIATLLAACSSDPIQKDLLNYINEEMPKVSTLESKAISAYSSVSGENYQSDSIMYATISGTVVPTYQEFYTVLQTIKPTTPEVAAMHQEYLDAASDQIEAFKLILEAIEKQDAQIIQKANADLTQARAMLDDWRKKLDEQCKAHNVIIKK